MSHQNLTSTYLKSILDYDRRTGNFYWKVNRVRAKIGDRAGYARKDGYWYIKIDQVKYARHNLAWLFETGEWPVHEIDHKNRTPGNDWISNLRDVPHYVNMRNTKRSYIAIPGV